MSATSSTYLSRTFGSGDNLRKWTFSCWVKRSNLGSNNWIFHAITDTSNENSFFFDGSDRLCFSIYEGGNNDYGRLTSTRKFRDVNCWYHLQIVWGSANSTGADRMIMYVNGVRETAFDTNTTATLNFEGRWNRNGVVHRIGAYNAGGAYMFFEGSMSHIHFSDGYALAPTVFGETDSTTGEWKIKTNPSFTLGTNGFSILKDGNTITDQSSNSNDWTLSAGTLTKTEDCPDNVFATLNPLEPMGANVSFENGNTSFKCSDSSWRMFKGTLGMSSGKFYWEFKPTVDKGGDYAQIGILDAETFDPDDYIGNETYGYAYMFDGRKNVPAGASSYGDTWTTNDIISVALDMDNRKLYFAKNGTWQNSGVPTSGSTGTGAISVSATPSTFMVAGSLYEGSGGAPIYQFNFGNGYFGTTAISSEGTNASGIGKFEYDVPTGYTALSTKGLNE